MILLKLDLDLVLVKVKQIMIRLGLNLNVATEGCCLKHRVKDKVEAMKNKIDLDIDLR